MFGKSLVISMLIFEYMCANNLCNERPSFGNSCHSTFSKNQKTKNICYLPNKHARKPQNKLLIDILHWL